MKDYQTREDLLKQIKHLEKQINNLKKSFEKSIDYDQTQISPKLSFSNLIKYENIISNSLTENEDCFAFIVDRNFNVKYSIGNTYKKYFPITDIIDKPFLEITSNGHNYYKELNKALNGGSSEVTKKIEGDLLKLKFSPVEFNNKISDVFIYGKIEKN